jgi:hypothetical protein
MDGQATPLGADRPSAVRTWVVTGEVTAFGLSAHHVGGGGLPSTGLVLALAALVGVASFLLRRRILTLPVTAAVAVAGQIGLHAAFAASGGHGAHGTSSQLTPAMLGAHAAAAAVTVLALQWQERLLVRLVALALPAPLVPVPARASVAPAPYDVVGGVPRCLQVAGSAPRRGPPALSAAH